MSILGLSRVEELEAKCSELEKLYHEAVTARDEAIEERNSATVVIALQLEKETHELNLKIEELTEANDKLLDENEDLDIKLEYARKDLKKLQVIDRVCQSVVLSKMWFVVVVTIIVYVVDVVDVVVAMVVVIMIVIIVVVVLM